MDLTNPVGIQLLLAFVADSEHNINHHNYTLKAQCFGCGQLAVMILTLNAVTAYCEDDCQTGINSVQLYLISHDAKS